jgi:hypothetical protein
MEKTKQTVYYYTCINDKGETVRPRRPGTLEAITHAERSRLARLVRTCSSMWCAQMPTRPLRIAQAERSPLDQCGKEGKVNGGAARPLYAPTAVATGDNRTLPSGKLRSMSPLQTPPSVRGCRTCWTPEPSLKGWHARLCRRPPVYRKWREETILAPITWFFLYSMESIYSRVERQNRGG